MGRQLARPSAQRPPAVPPAPLGKWVPQSGPQMGSPFGRLRLEAGEVRTGVCAVGQTWIPSLLCRGVAETWAPSCAIRCVHCVMCEDDAHPGQWLSWASAPISVSSFLPVTGPGGACGCDQLPVLAGRARAASPCGLASEEARGLADVPWLCLPVNVPEETSRGLSLPPVL